MKRFFTVKRCIGLLLCLEIIVCALCVKTYRAEPRTPNAAPEEAPALTVKSGEVIFSPGENTTVSNLKISPAFRQTAQDEEANRITFRILRPNENNTVALLQCSASTAASAEEANVETSGSALWNVEYRVGWQTFSSAEAVTFRYITNGKDLNAAA